MALAEDLPLRFFFFFFSFLATDVEFSLSLYGYKGPGAHTGAIMRARPAAPVCLCVCLLVCLFVLIACICLDTDMARPWINKINK